MRHRQTRLSVAIILEIRCATRSQRTPSVYRRVDSLLLLHTWNDNHDRPISHILHRKNPISNNTFHMLISNSSGVPSYCIPPRLSRRMNKSITEIDYTSIEYPT